MFYSFYNESGALVANSQQILDDRQQVNALEYAVVSRNLLLFSQLFADETAQLAAFKADFESLANASTQQALDYYRNSYNRELAQFWDALLSTVNRVDACVISEADARAPICRATLSRALTRGLATSINTLLNELLESPASLSSLQQLSSAGSPLLAQFVAESKDEQLFQYLVLDTLQWQNDYLVAAQQRESEAFVQSCVRNFLIALATNCALILAQYFLLAHKLFAQHTVALRAILLMGYNKISNDQNNLMILKSLLS